MSEPMRELGFQDPDEVRQSEYRAMYEVIDSVIDQFDGGERSAMAITILEEFIELAKGEIARLKRDGLVHDQEFIEDSNKE